jgi:hypothetical protein
MTARRCRTTADSSAVTTLRPGLVAEHSERCRDIDQSIKEV